MDNLEKIVTDAILERASDVLVIDGTEYPIAPPTPATLILISEQASFLPEVQNEENVLTEVLCNAKDSSVIGKIAAILVLGAKRIKERRMVEIEVTLETRKWSWRKLRHVTVSSVRKRRMLEVDYLAERILDEVTNETLLKVLTKRLGAMQLGAFFQLTTSLSAANQLKRTREVVTASGD